MPLHGVRMTHKVNCPPAYHYIKHEQLVMRKKDVLCRFCLMAKTDMKQISCLELERSKIPQIYEETTSRKLEISDEYSQLMCRTCERSMTMAAKARRDFLVVDDFWKRYLFKHGIPDGRHKNPDEVLVAPSSVIPTAPDNSDDTITFHDTKQTMPAPIAEDVVDRSKIEINPLSDPLPIEVVHVKVEPNLDEDDELKIEYPQPFGDFEHFADDDDDDDSDDGEKSEPPQANRKKQSTKKRIKDRLPDIEPKYPGVKPAEGNNKRFRCTQINCAAEYDEMHELNSHMDNDHDVMQLSCNECDHTFTSLSKIRHHVKEHIDKTCSRCQKTYTAFDFYKRHIRQCRETDSCTTCEHCGKTLKSGKSLARHLLTHSHGVHLICYICGKGYKNQKYLRRHLHIHTEKKKTFQCTYCPKAFAKKSTQTVHERMHTGERPHMCDKCGAAFTQNRLLVRHKLLHLRAPGNKLPGRGRRVQNGTIKCELCESMFINLNSLRRHLRKYHNNQPSTVYDEKRATTCSKCNMSFSDPKQLTRHKFTHLEFECDICKQRYSTGKALDAHKNIHGNKVHPFKCSECGAAYTRKASMLQHYRDVHLNHRPHTCMHCNRQYSKEYDLKRHIQVVHNKNRPYECQMCDRTFSTAFQMRQHMQYHTGNFRYRCPVCEKVFVNAQALAKHARNSKMCLQKEPALAKIGGCSQHLVPPPPPDQILSGPVPDQTIGLPPQLSLKVDQPIAVPTTTQRPHSSNIISPSLDGGSHSLPLVDHRLLSTQTVETSMPLQQHLLLQHQQMQNSPSLPVEQQHHHHHHHQHHQQHQHEHQQIQQQHMQQLMQPDQHNFQHIQQPFDNFTQAQRIFSDPVKPTALMIKFPYR